MGWQDGHGGAFGGGSWNGPAHTSGGLNRSGGGGWGGKSGSGGNSGAPLRTGLTTGSTWYGNTAFGQPGGMAQGYATRGANGQFGNFRSLSGAPMQGGFTSANGFPGVARMQQRTPSLPSPGGYATPVPTQPIPPPATVVPTALTPPNVMPPLQKPIPRPSINFNPSLPQYSGMQSAVQVPHRQMSNWGASNYSYYNNPTLGTPGHAGGGLANYASGSNWGSKGNLGGR